MFLTEPQRAVLEALRAGALDHHQVAADLSRSPWLVRETLMGLRGHRLVTDELGPRRHTWRLTPLGLSHLWAGDQLALTEAQS